MRTGTGKPPDDAKWPLAVWSGEKWFVARDYIWCSPCKQCPYGFWGWIEEPEETDPVECKLVDTWVELGSLHEETAT